ncbi:MAG: hypothetical protein WB870_00380 [Gallionellaceae bacterium]
MTKKGLPTIDPEESLSETLSELGVSQAAFLRTIGVPPMRISHVIKGTRPVTAELARSFFGRAFDQSPQYRARSITSCNTLERLRYWDGKNTKPVQAVECRRNLSKCY